MNSALIDTSTLLDLVLGFNSEPSLFTRFPPYSQDSSSVWDAIEALVIFDSISVDGPTYSGFIDGSRTWHKSMTGDIAERIGENSIRARLVDVGQFCKPLEIPPEKEAQIYLRIVKVLERYLKDEENTGHLPLPRGHLQFNLAIESNLGLSNGSWVISDILDYMPSHIINSLERIISLLDEKHYTNKNSSAARWLFFIRLCYYAILQDAYNVHLIPHRSKAVFLPDAKPDSTLSNSILDYFDNQVSSSFEKKKREIFGETAVSIPLPLVSSYVMQNVTSWEQLIDRIHVIRNSSEAIGYRKAIGDVSQMLENRDNQKISRVLDEIAYAAEIWQKSLNIPLKKKRIEISLPFFIGLSTELDIPLPVGHMSASNKISAFVYKLLAGV